MSFLDSNTDNIANDNANNNAVNTSSIDDSNDIFEVDDNEENISDDEVIPRNKKSTSKAEHDHEVRKRIDDLLEKRRLKELLDDSEDW